jgi:AcrR family transcriptional regulator
VARSSTRNAQAPKGTLNEARWSEIIDAAASVFAAKGYQAATVQDIASRVGLLKGSLYYYIESKEDLLFALVERAYLDTIDWITTSDAVGVGDAPTRMRTFIERWMANLAQQSARMKLTEREGRHLSAQHAAAVRKLASRIEAMVRTIIEEGVAEGSFFADTDAVTGAKSILSLLNATAAWYRPSGPLSWADITASHQRFVLGGLGATLATAVDAVDSA